MPDNYEPFAQHVERLAHERGRGLTKVLEDAHREDVRGTSPDLFKRVRRGELPLRRPLIESIAVELKVSPWTFPEWRLLAVREAIDPQPGRVGDALRNLKAIENGATGEEIAEMIRSAIAPAGAPPPAPGGELGRRIANPRTSDENPQRKQPRRAGGSQPGNGA
jgi:hypothetical protein